MAIQTAQEGISWSECADASDASLPRPTECAAARLPLRYDGGSDSLLVAIMRIPASRQAVAQLWFLDGGPGDAGTASLPRLARILATPDVDLLTVEHRGVGGSSLFSCPEPQEADSPDGREINRAEWADCMAFLRGYRPDLDALTVTNAAIDLGRIIDRLREPAKPVVIVAVSHGTYLALRYLNLFPDQPQAVILDAIVPPDWSFPEFDAGLDTVARRTLARCSQDAECHRRLGPDPIQTAIALLDTLGTGHCGGIGLTPQLTRVVLGNMLIVDAVPHAFLAGLIHRVRRCAWHDRLALLRLFRAVFSAVGEPASHSQVLQRHVAMSELWPEGAKEAKAFQLGLEGYVSGAFSVPMICGVIRLA